MLDKASNLSRGNNRANDSKRSQSLKNILSFGCERYVKESRDTCFSRTGPASLAGLLILNSFQEYAFSCTKYQHLIQFDLEFITYEWSFCLATKTMCLSSYLPQKSEAVLVKCHFKNISVSLSECRKVGWLLFCYTWIVWGILPNLFFVIVTGKFGLPHLLKCTEIIASTPLKCYNLVKLILFCFGHYVLLIERYAEKTACTVDLLTVTDLCMSSPPLSLLSSIPFSFSSSHADLFF